MAKATPAGGGKSPAGAGANDSVLDYLRNAPDELQPWAREKLEELAPSGQNDVEARTEPTAQESAARETGSNEDIGSSAVEAGILEENDLALAELGEMDDDQQRAVRQARKRSRKNRVASAVAPRDEDTPESGQRTDAATAAGPRSRPVATPGNQAASSSKVALEPKPEKKSKLFTILMVTALSLGLAFGVFMIGADDQKPLADAQMPDGHPDISQMQQPSPEFEDYSERLFELEIETRQNPDDWEARLEMGVLLMNQRDFEEAEEQWLTVLDGTGGHAEAYYNLGFLYTQLDPPQFDDAIAAWESLIEIDPDSELALDVKPFYDTLLAGPPDGTPENTP